MANQKKHIVITGASGGIGEIIVEKAINSGLIVVGNGLEERKLFKLQQKYGEGRFLPFVLNLTDVKNFYKFQEFIKNKIGGIDWLIHCAGFINENESKLLFDQEMIENTFEINVESVIALSYLLMPLIQKDGGIIAVSSTAGLWGNELYPIYSSSKGALNIFMRSLARQMKKTSQSSITICPGPTNTVMRERIAHDAIDHQSPEIVANVIANIIKGINSYKNGDIVIVKNNLESLHSQLDQKL